MILLAVLPPIRRNDDAKRFKDAMKKQSKNNKDTNFKSRTNDFLKAEFLEQQSVRKNK